MSYMLNMLLKGYDNLLNKTRIIFLSWRRGFVKYLTSFLKLALIFFLVILFINYYGFDGI